MTSPKKIYILGAGIIGLNTACILKEKYKDWDITVIAEKFNEETLSNVAAGIFRPSPSFTGPTPEVTR